MGHHLTEDNKFRSDKYPWCPEGYFALSFKDPIARVVIRHYAQLTPDKELEDDLNTAVKTARKETT